MIVIPEKIIKEELEVLMRRYYDELIGLELVGTVIDATDVDAGVSISVTTQGQAGTAEITDVTLPDGSAIGGKTWELNTPSRRYTVWYNSGNNVIPVIADRQVIQINIDSGDTDLTIAVKTAAALNIVRTYGDTIFTLPVPTTAIITVTNIETNAERLSLLYSIFGGQEFDGLKYFTQMGGILKNKYRSESRKLSIILGFNLNIEDFPSISIILPMEEPAPKNIGIAQGVINNFDGTFNELKESNYTTTYSLYITSDNQNDVILIYHFLKTIIIAGYLQFSANGFNNLSVSGRDITIDFDLDPDQLYHRTVALSFFYTNTFSNVNKKLGTTAVNIDGAIKGSVVV